MLLCRSVSPPGSIRGARECRRSSARLPGIERSQRDHLHQHLRGDQPAQGVLRDEVDLPPEDPGELSLQAGVPKEVGRSRPLDQEVDVAVGPRRGSRDRSEDGEAGAVLPAPALDRLPMGIDELPYSQPPTVRGEVDLRLVEPQRLAAGAPYGNPPAKSPHIPAPVAVPESNPTTLHAPVLGR